jgi:hypothetical protein
MEHAARAGGNCHVYSVRGLTTQVQQHASQGLPAPCFAAAVRPGSIQLLSRLIPWQLLLSSHVCTAGGLLLLVTR